MIRTAVLSDIPRLTEIRGAVGENRLSDPSRVTLADYVWHIERANTPPSDLASVPLRRIIGVELNDADSNVVGTLFEDTVHRRRYCGEGAFDLDGIITALRTAGWTGPWGVEILSVEYRALPVQEALRRAADSARNQLKRGSVQPNKQP